MLDNAVFCSGDVTTDFIETQMETYYDRAQRRRHGAAPGVVETIVSIAANEVKAWPASARPPRAACAPCLAASRPRRASRSPWARDDKLQISIRVDVYYGFVLPDLAASIRQAISDAVTSQVGIPWVPWTCTSKRHAVRPLNARRL